MLDTTMLDIVQGAGASAGAGIVGIMGWLASKLWGAYRHEISDMKQSITGAVSAFTRCVERFEEHMQRDEEVQAALMADIREMRGYIKGQHDQPLNN